MLDLTNKMTAVYDGIIGEPALDEAIQQARQTSALTLEVLVSIDDFPLYRGLLERNDFTTAGVVTRGTPETKSYIRFRKNVRTSGDGTAIDSVDFGKRADYENRAITECLARFRKPEQTC